MYSVLVIMMLKVQQHILLKILIKHLSKPCERASRMFSFNYIVPGVEFWMRSTSATHGVMPAAHHIQGGDSRLFSEDKC